jgi:hypothetical protein
MFGAGRDKFALSARAGTSCGVDAAAGSASSRGLMGVPPYSRVRHGMQWRLECAAQETIREERLAAQQPTSEGSTSRSRR